MLKGNILLKLIQLALIFYLLLRSLKTSILLIFFKELFSSSIFSREEIFRIRTKKIRIAKAGSKAIIEKLLEMKNKYTIENKTERIITDFLKTAIIEKECIKSLKKFIWVGPKYLRPLIDGTDTRSDMIFVTEPEKLLQIQASLTNLVTASLGKQL